MEIQGRIAPQAADAERSVLGCMLLDRSSVTLAMELLVPEDFYQAQHVEIFAQMAKLNAGGKPIDLVTLATQLSSDGRIDSVGGMSYLVELSQAVPTTANIKTYIALVKEKAVLRRLIDVCGQIIAHSYSGSMTTPEVLEFAEKQIYNIVTKRESEALEGIRPILMRTYSEIEKLFINKGQISGVPTGFAELDKLTTGFHGGEFILVAARPSMGKTAFMLNIAQHAAMVGKKKVAFFSLEMPKVQLGTRALCSEARVNLQKVRQGSLSESDWGSLAGAMGPLAMAPLYFDDTASITVPELRSKCRKMKIETGLDLVMIDYLQLMNASGRHDSRQNEVSEISRQMKILALELDIPIVVGSQLSRAPEQRGKDQHRPVLSDLRDSGAIEQDADVVMFLYRDSYYDPESPASNVSEVIIQKQRNGPLGTVELAFINEYTRFMNLSNTQQEPPK